MSEDKASEEPQDISPWTSVTPPPATFAREESAPMPGMWINCSRIIRMNEVGLISAEMLDPRSREKVEQWKTTGALVLTKKQQINEATFVTTTIQDIATMNKDIAASTVTFAQLSTTTVIVEHATIVCTNKHTMNCKVKPSSYHIEAALMDENKNAMDCLMWDPTATTYMGMAYDEFNALPTPDEWLAAKERTQFTVYMTCALDAWKKERGKTTLQWTVNNIVNENDATNTEDKAEHKSKN